MRVISSGQTSLTLGVPLIAAILQMVTPELLCSVPTQVHRVGWQQMEPCWRASAEPKIDGVPGVFADWLLRKWG